MVKILNYISIIIFALMSMITKSISSDISTILRNQQLTVFDIGIFRLQENLKALILKLKNTKMYHMKIFTWMFLLHIETIQ